MGGGRPKRSNPNRVILLGFPFPFVFALDLRFRLLPPLPGFECKERVSARSLSDESAKRPCSSSGRARGIRLTAGLYSSGCSADIVGRFVFCKLSEDETGRRQGMHEPSAILTVSDHEKGVVIVVVVGGGWDWEVGGKFEETVPNWDQTPT